MEIDSYAEFRRKAGCDNKEGFDNKAMAQTTCRKMIERYKKNFLVYKCKSCGFYHIGNDNFSEGKVIKNFKKKKRETYYEPF
jgi:predicted nucleic-acid-binding Zn-ribbon protein